MTRTDHYHDPDAPGANSIVVAVAAFVLDDNDQLLMIRRTDSGKYALPGGGQEVGETLTQAVVRETYEETGIDVEVTGLIGIYSDPGHVIAYTDGEVRQEFAICFRARPMDGQLRTSNETSEVHWVRQRDIATLDVHPTTRLRIDHGYAGPTEPYYT
jgi:ADP-ribose pyrophosphatase YjhB (NUDIX family)